MPRSLEPNIAAKLARVAGLLGSDFDGERAEAARRATMILRENGWTWADVFAPRPATDEAPAPPRSHAATANWALRHPGFLSEWEVRFLEDLRRLRKLTSKQSAALETIVQKLRAAGINAPP